MTLGRNRERLALCFRGGLVVLGILALCAAWASAQSSPGSPFGSPRPNGGWGAVWSPRGDRVAFLSSADGLPAEAWVCDRQGGDFRRLTHGGADDLAWSADGRGLTFATSRRGRAERWRVNLESGQETAEVLRADLPAEAAQTIAPDGKSVAYTRADLQYRDLYLATGAAEAKAVTSGFTVGTVAWSPKSDRVAFDCLNPLSKGLPQVWLYDLSAQKLAHIGSLGSFGPVWSPKGDLLAYTVMSPGRGNRVAITRPDVLFVLKHSTGAGTKATVAHVETEASQGGMVKGLLYQGDGMAWSPAGDLLAVVVRAGKEQRIRFVNPRGKVVAYLARPGLRFRLPVWSPDGKSLAMEAVQTGVSAFSEVWITDIKGKQWRDLTPSRPSYWALSPAAGHLFFLGNTAGVVKAWSVASQAARSDGTSTPTSLPGTEGASEVVASPQGERALIVKEEAVTLLSADGRSLSSLPLRGVAEAHWSPQGDRIVIGLKSDIAEDTIKLLSVSADGTLAETATVPGADPSWRPDGAALTFVRSNLLWRMDADGAHPTALATVPVAAGEETVILNPAWDPKGESIAFAVTRSTPAGSRQELWLLPLGSGTGLARTADPKSQLIYSEEVATEYALSPTRWHALPAWTPEGRLLFSSDRGGSPQVWSVRPDGSDLRAITPPNAIWPALGPDGLYFIRPNSETAAWKVSADGSDPAPLAWKN